MNVSQPVVLDDSPTILGGDDVAKWDAPQFDLLKQIARVNPLGNNTYSVTRKPDRAGHLSINGRAFVARPPFPNEVLLQMLMFSGGLNWIQKGTQPVGVENRIGRPEGSIPEMIANALLRACSELLCEHLIQGYVQRTERGGAIRGRIDPCDPGLRMGRPRCTYYEKSTDNVHNQLLVSGLRAATHILPRTRSIGQATEMLGRFRDLARETAPTSSQADAVIERLNPHFEHYRAALVLARALIFGYLPTDLLSPGTLHLPGMVFDLGRLFEDFVYRVLKEIIPDGPHGLQAQVQDRRALTDGDGDAYASIRPDLTINRHGEVVAVLDAKFKPGYTASNAFGEPRKRVSTADLYQLFFYQRRHMASVGPLPHAFIVSPLVGEDVPSSVKKREINFSDSRGRLAQCRVVAVPLEPLVHALNDLPTVMAVERAAPELWQAIISVTTLGPKSS